MVSRRELELAAINRWVVQQPGLVSNWLWEHDTLLISINQVDQVLTRQQLIEAGCRLDGSATRRLLEQSVNLKPAETTADAKELDRLRRIAADIYSQGDKKSDKAEVSGVSRRISSHARKNRHAVGTARQLVAQQTPGVAIKAKTG